MKILLKPVLKSSSKVSTSKKQKTPRQIFLGALMGFTSGDRGEEMANAFADGNRSAIEDMMEDLKKHMAEEAEKIAKKSKKD